MMRFVWPLPAILALATAASAEEPPENAPVIRLTTLANPIINPVASGNRRALLGPEESLTSLPGIFSIHSPDSPIYYAWDPVECRLLFCQRNEELIYLAEGPGPAAPTVGAFGPPKFFGYRLADGGVPEFLYMHGRLGVEEQIRPGDDGKTLKQRFRIENADYGLILAVPARWKDKIKSSAGSWSGDTLKISKDQAKSGFTLTYDLSDPPELPEIAKSWGAPVSEDAQVGPPGPPEPPVEAAGNRIEAAPGYSIEMIPIPGGKKIRGLGRFDDDGLVIDTESGGLMVSEPAENGADREWSSFLRDPLPDLRVLDAVEMPDSVLVSHSYGIARLYDTDLNGKADFFKVIREETGTSSNQRHLLTLKDWDVYQASLQRHDESNSAALFLTALGLNPEQTPSPSIAGPAIWIPESLCSKPTEPLILERIRPDGSTETEIAIHDPSAEDQWGFVRILFDRTGETLQGAAVDSRWASPASSKLDRVIPSEDGETLWATPENGGFLAKITRDPEAQAFEVRSVHLAPDAFEFTFSHPIDRTIAADPGAIRIHSSDPRHPGIDRRHRIEAAIVDSDAMTLSLRVAAVKPGCLLEFDLAPLRSGIGAALSHGPVYYTVNAIADYPVPGGRSIQPGNSTASSGTADASVSPSKTTESSRESNEAGGPDSP